MKVTKKLIARLARERTLNPLFEQGWMTVEVKKNPVAVLVLDVHWRMKVAILGLASLLDLGTSYWLMKLHKLGTGDWLWAAELLLWAGLGFVAWFFVTLHSDGFWRDDARAFVKAVDLAFRTLYPQDGLRWESLLMIGMEGELQGEARRRLLECALARVRIQEELNKGSFSTEEADALQADARAYLKELRRLYDAFRPVGLADPSGYAPYYREAEQLLAEEKMS